MPDGVVHERSNSLTYILEGRVKHKSLFVFLALVLAGCSPVTAKPPENATVTPTLTSAAALPPEATPTVAPQPTATAAATVTPAVVIDAASGCLVPAANPQGQVKLSGRPVFLSPGKLPFWYDLASGERGELGEVEKSPERVVAVSPDGRWFAYSAPAEGGRTLVVAAADGGQHFNQAIEGEWKLHGWLSPQYVRLVVGTPDQAYTLVVDPFTGQRTQIPAFAAGGKPGANQRDFLLGTANDLPDPTLKSVVYPAASGGGLVVWDVQEQKPFPVRQDFSYSMTPMWAPDGSQFLMLEQTKPNDAAPTDNWLSVNRQGEVRQVTHLESQYPGARIRAYSSWSPDGRFIAFLLSDAAGLNGASRWQVLDVEKGTLSPYCLVGPAADGFADAAWSPDGHYLLVGHVYPGSEVKPQWFVIDLYTGWAVDVSAQVKDAMRSFGWLAAKE